MAKHVIVNNEEHKDIKIITKRSAELGDNIWYAQTFPQEFRAVQAHYPIFFSKNPETGQFLPVALFGFKHQENLFLDEQGWHASYIPAAVMRQPFLIAQQTITENGEEKQQRMLSMDMDNPRVSTEEGEPLFLPYGGNSEFLDKVANMLEALHFGVSDGTQFCQALTDMELLEPFTLDVQLQTGEKHQMIGFYTINEDKLAALSNEQLERLHKDNYLQAIYMALASQSNVRTLLNKKNALEAAAQPA